MLNEARGHSSNAAALQRVQRAPLAPAGFPLANPSNSDAIPTVWCHSDANPQDFVIVESPRGSEVAAMRLNPFKRVRRCIEHAGSHRGVARPVRVSDAAEDALHGRYDDTEAWAGIGDFIEGVPFTAQTRGSPRMHSSD